MRATTAINFVAILSILHALVNVNVAWAQVDSLGTCYREANCMVPDHTEAGDVNQAKVFSSPCASFRALHTGGHLSGNCGKCPCPNAQAAVIGDNCYSGVTRWCPDTKVE